MRVINRRMLPAEMEVDKTCHVLLRNPLTGEDLGSVATHGSMTLGDALYKLFCKVTLKFDYSCYKLVLPVELANTRGMQGVGLGHVFAMVTGSRWSRSDVMSVDILNLLSREMSTLALDGLFDCSVIYDYFDPCDLSRSLDEFIQRYLQQYMLMSLFRNSSCCTYNYFYGFTR